jgi:hypothetical protein
MSKLARIRKDLQESNLAVHVGKLYYLDSEPLPYRWIGEEFQVLIDDKWETADSVEWEFD